MFRILATAIALLCAMPAAAGPGRLTASGAAGYDDPTRNIWTGVDLSLHANNRKGLGVIGALTPAYGFDEGRPMGFGELGVVHWIKAEQAIVRVGVVARTALVSVPYSVAVQLGRSGDNRIGLVPAAMLHLEFEYGQKNAYVFGVRVGMGSGLSNFRCTDPNDLSGCALWTESVVANAIGKVFMSNGLFGELHLGHNSKLSVGYTF